MSKNNPVYILKRRKDKGHDIFNLIKRLLWPHTAGET